MYPMRETEQPPENTDTSNNTPTSQSIVTRAFNAVSNLQAVLNNFRHAPTQLSDEQKEQLESQVEELVEKAASISSILERSDDNQAPNSNFNTQRMW